VVGGLALEHFGGLQFVESGNDYTPTGRAATTYIWGWPNPLAIEEATRAIKEQKVPRAMSLAPARPGVNGKAQQPWLGGGFSRYLVDLGGWPGWHISGDWPSAGFQAYYPSAKTRVSAEVFLKQSAAAVQLANALMVKDVIALAPAWGYLQTAIATLDEESFLDREKAAQTRASLSKDFDGVFEQVKAGRYDQAAALLPALETHAENVLTAKESGRLRDFIEACEHWSERGFVWKTTGLIRN
jgi:hypothetical protein